MHPWKPEERQLVCSTVETLHASLTTALPQVRSLIANGILSPYDFTHEKYNGCEIIP
jgi:hypothetical protein